LPTVAELVEFSYSWPSAFEKHIRYSF